MEIEYPAKHFTANGAWAGGFYELALEIGPRSDDALQAALTALWNHPDLTGCFLDRTKEPQDQPRVRPDCLDDGSHLFGVAKLPNGKTVTCGTCIIQEVNDGSDWLDFYLPTGSLGHAYPTNGFPFTSNDDWPGSWRDEVDEWFAGIALRIAKSASFHLGTIGFEMSGQVYAADLQKNGVPSERFVGYVWEVNQKMTYFARNA